jgi:signal transduction histidine kinase/ligand-binding sensor domain-containing protein
LQLSSVAQRSPPVDRSVIALLLFSFVFLLSSSHASEPPKHISQYGHTAWRLEDGYFQSSPQTIAQTVDGYLWFGTPTGTLRFDGVRFTTFTIPTNKNVLSDTISLLGSSDGSLWLGTGGGLVRSYKGKVTLYPQVTGHIDAIIEDHNHEIWVAQARLGAHASPLCEVREDKALCHGAAEGIDKPYAVSLVEASDRTLWVAHSNSLSHWSRGVARVVTIPGLNHRLGLSGIGSTLANSDGSVWIGMSSVGKGLGLEREYEGKFSSLQLPGFNSEQIAATALLHDNDGALWVGTLSKGLYRLKGGVANHFGSLDGLSSDTVYSLFQDKEGNIWVATSSGIDRFRSLRVTTFSPRDGLAAGSTSAVVATHAGTIWVGNEGALDRIKGNTVTSIRKKNGLPGESITSLVEDRDGLLWVGIDNGLATYDREHFSSITADKGEPLGIIRSIVQDANVEDMYALAIRDSHEHLLRIRNRHVISDAGGVETERSTTIAADPAGGIFVGLTGGRLRHWDGERFLTIHEGGGDHAGNNAMTVDSDGTVWGASDYGLLGTRAGRLAVLDKAKGLPCSAVEQVIEDKRGNLWLHMPCGLVIISRDEVRAFWAEPEHTMRVRTLTVFDGYFSGPSIFTPGMSLGSDGRVWFVNGQVVQVVDPEMLSSNTFQPPIHVEQVTADLIPYLPSETVHLPPLIRNLRIDYTGLSFSVPQNVMFRYRLSGFEQDWQEAGNRRQAFYNNLRPGRYVFQVAGSNTDGVWGNIGDSVTILVAPAFYQTPWFRLLVIAFCLALLYLMYLARLRFTTAEVQTRIMVRLGERERIARDLHDTFFQAIQGLLLKFNTGTSQLRNDDPARAVFVTALEESDRAMLEGRELLLDLRATMDTAELATLFAQAGEDLQDVHSAAFKVTVLGQSRPLHPLTATEIYRIGKEALHNAFKHSEASHIEIELEYVSDALKLRVRDDGRGIDEKIMQDGMRKGHWGLPGMHERATKIGGRINVWSRKDEGTEIEISVPAADAYLVTNAKLLPSWLQRLIRKVLPHTGQPNA